MPKSMPAKSVKKQVKKALIAAKPAKPAAAKSSVTGLKETYFKEAVPQLMTKLNIKNKYAVPRIKYVKVNAGIGSYVVAGKDYEDVVKNITAITGQKPIVIKSKKAISNFKLKIGMPVGVVVTLRGKRMYDFLTKLVNVVLPRIRDFRGISKHAFDGKGNYSLGIREHVVFPEIIAEDVGKFHGLQVNIVTTAKSKEEGHELLKVLKFPFKKT